MTYHVKRNRLADGRLVSDLTPRQVATMRTRLHKELAAEWPLRHDGWMHRSGARRSVHVLRMLRDNTGDIRARAREGGDEA